MAANVRRSKTAFVWAFSSACSCAGNTGVFLTVRFQASSVRLFTRVLNFVGLVSIVRLPLIGLGILLPNPTHAQSGGRSRMPTWVCCYVFSSVFESQSQEALRSASSAASRSSQGVFEGATPYITVPTWRKYAYWMSPS